MKNRESIWKPLRRLNHKHVAPVAAFVVDCSSSSEQQQLLLTFSATRTTTTYKPASNKQPPLSPTFLKELLYKCYETPIQNISFLTTPMTHIHHHNQFHVSPSSNAFLGLLKGIPREQQDTANMYNFTNRGNNLNDGSVNQMINTGTAHVNSTKHSSFVLRRLNTGGAMQIDKKYVEDTFSQSIIGMSIDSLCDENTVKRPLIDLVALLYWKGSETADIFRRAPNYRKVSIYARRLMPEINTRHDNCSTQISSVIRELIDEPHMVASILKRFLMRLETPFFDMSVCESWRECSANDDLNVDGEFRGMFCEQRLGVASKLINSMLVGKITFWRYLLSALNKIHINSHITKMNSENLGICISGTLFKNDSCSLDRACNMSRIATDFVSFNIANSHSLFPSTSLHVQGMLESYLKAKLLRVEMSAPMLTAISDAKGSDGFIMSDKLKCKQTSVKDIPSHCSSITAYSTDEDIEEDDKQLTIYARIHRRLGNVRDRVRETAKRMDVKVKLLRRSSLLDRCDQRPNRSFASSSHVESINLSLNALNDVDDDEQNNVMLRHSIFLKLSEASFNRNEGTAAVFSSKSRSYLNHSLRLSTAPNTTNDTHVSPVCLSCTFQKSSVQSRLCRVKKIRNMNKYRRSASACTCSKVPHACRHTNVITNDTISR